MKNKTYKISDMDKIIVQEYVDTMFSEMDSDMTIRDNLYHFAVLHGYSAEEAVELINDVIIPTVDQYNSSCRIAYESGADKWVHQTIINRVDSMSITEEVNFKKNLILSIYSVESTLLTSDGLLNPADWDTINEAFICANDIIDGTATLEDLEKVNEELENAICNSKFILHHADAFVKLVENKSEDDEVIVIDNPLWEDSEYKYCLALATCIARKKGRLSSVSEDIPDQAIILGLCQGVDFERVEQQLSRGEIALDKAYKILKTITAVALALVAIFVMVKVGIATAAISGTFVYTLLGAGILGTVAGCLLALGVFDEVLKSMTAFAGKVAVTLSKGADFTYSMLKKGAKKICTFLHDKIVPGIETWFHRVVTFAEGIANRFSKTFLRQTVDLQ